MTTGGSGAVFFLGTRAHYQVLQQPERSYDVENGNASTETIYQNPSVRDVWNNGQSDTASCVSERTVRSYCDNEVSDDNKLEIGGGVKRRNNRRPSEATLCERDNDMKPALLNSLDSGTPVSMSLKRISPLSFLSSLARRKRRHSDRPNSADQTLAHIESALTTCSYRESCRCLDCQSRYFECDESDDYTSDEDDYATFAARYTTQQRDVEYGGQNYNDDDDDDEVFIDTVPGDNTSTDLLLDKKMSVSSSSPSASSEDEETMQLEVAAGTPVLLNYLLTHPITCAIQ